MLEGCVGGEGILAAAPMGTFRGGDGLAKVMQDAGVGTEGSVAAALGSFCYGDGFGDICWACIGACQGWF